MQLIFFAAVFFASWLALASANKSLVDIVNETVASTQAILADTETTSIARVTKLFSSRVTDDAEQAVDSADISYYDNAESYLQNGINDLLSYWKSQIQKTIDIWLAAVEEGKPLADNRAWLKGI